MHPNRELHFKPNVRHELIRAGVTSFFLQVRAAPD